MKGKKTSWILCLCMFVLFSVGALIFGLNTPKNKTVAPIIDANVTSIVYQQNGTGFYYSGGTKLVYVNENGDQKEALDLSEQTGGERIYSLLSLDGTGQILAFSDNTVAYLLEEKEDSLALVGQFPYSGKPLKLAKDENELYVIYEVGNYCEVRAYELDNIEKDYVRRGLFYNYGGKGEGSITLTLAKGLRPVYAFVKENKLYMAHEGGIYMMDTSMKMNNFKYLTEEERVQAGLLSYNKNSYEAVVSEEAFDSSAIAIYTTGISAACYHEGSDNLYFVSNERKLMSYPLSEFGTQEIGSDLQMKEVPGVVLQDTQTAKPMMFFDENNETGYLTFDTIDDLVCVDFATEEVRFKSKGQFDVRDVASSSNAEKILLMYLDTNAGSNETFYLEIVDAKKQANRNLFKTLMIACLVIAAVSLVLTIFMARRSGNATYNDKVKKTLKKMWKHKWIYVILIPSLAGLFMFCYYPGIASLGLSFFDYTAEKQSMKWNNFENYISIFTNKYSLEAFRNMVIFAITDVLTALIPPLIFAFFLSFMRSKKFSNLTRTLLFIPGVIPAVAGTLIWNTGIYGEYGVLNTLIEAFNGEPVKFLASSGTALASIIMMGFPFVGSYLIFYGAIMNIADSYIEAAELEGCPLIKRLIKIDIPLIMPQLKYVLIMTLIHTAQNFNRVYMTTGGSWGTQIPINDMYNKLVAGNYGQSSAYAAILFLIMFIPMMLNLRTQKKGME